ncbi:MAG: hypothetical protein U0521_00520 [Anaerolineae bacterium]
MNYEEQLERARQAIMRFRELLDLLNAELEQSERNYEQLFARCTPEERETLKEKDLQLRAAIHLLDNRAALGDAALHMRFITRNLERDFEQLYDNIMTE